MIQHSCHVPLQNESCRNNKVKYTIKYTIDLKIIQKIISWKGKLKILSFTNYNTSVNYIFTENVI